MEKYKRLSLVQELGLGPRGLGPSTCSALGSVHSTHITTKNRRFIPSLLLVSLRNSAELVVGHNVVLPPEARALSLKGSIIWGMAFHLFVVVASLPATFQTARASCIYPGKPRAASSMLFVVWLSF